MGISVEIHRVAALLFIVSRSMWNLEIFVLVERGKPENPENTPGGKDENHQQTQPRRVRDSSPGHIDGRRVLSQLCHPCSVYIIFFYIL